jgi:hypothetical protein
MLDQRAEIRRLSSLLAAYGIPDPHRPNVFRRPRSPSIATDADGQLILQRGESRYVANALWRGLEGDVS